MGDKFWVGSVSLLRLRDGGRPYFTCEDGDWDGRPWTWRDHGGGGEKRVCLDSTHDGVPDCVRRGRGTETRTDRGRVRSPEEMVLTNK